MKKILVSGLVNTETTIKIRQFPIEYYPIDYPFFGVNTAVSGVAYNISKALHTLGDKVTLSSLVGNDIGADIVIKKINDIGISTDNILKTLRSTPNSAVLYDESGKRQIYCDLKDIQESIYNFDTKQIAQNDIIVPCNINFNRELLKIAKEAGKTIATDVHVLSNIDDEYNQDFMNFADILFLSDENVPEDYKGFMWSIMEKYNNKIIVLGRGSEGACMLIKNEGFVDLPAVKAENVVNTVGAGDALFSAFVHFYAAGNGPLISLQKAQIFASNKIGTNGAAEGFVTETEIEKIWRNMFTPK